MDDDLRGFLGVLFFSLVIFFSVALFVFNFDGSTDISVRVDQGGVTFVQGSHRNVVHRLDGEGLLSVWGVDGCNQVTGLSMRPTHFQGNTVCFMNYSGQRLLEGDIILYADESAGGTVHRVDAVYSDYVIARGDNNAGGERVNKSLIRKIVILTLYS